MPIYPQSDVPPSVMDNALQAPTGFDVSLPEGTNPEPQQQQPSVWDAAFRQNNLLAGMFRPAKQFEPAEGYNPYSDKNELKGYEQWGSAFADSQSPETAKEGCCLNTSPAECGRTPSSRRNVLETNQRTE